MAQCTRLEKWLNLIATKNDKASTFLPGCYALGNATMSGTSCGFGGPDAEANAAYNTLKQCPEQVENDCVCPEADLEVCNEHKETLVAIKVTFEVSFSINFYSILCVKNLFQIIILFKGMYQKTRHLYLFEELWHSYQGV